MKIQNLGFPEKVAYQNFAPAYGKFRYIYIRGGRQVCWSSLWQSVINGMYRWSGEKELPVQKVKRRFRTAIKHVHLGIYLTVIKHVHELASFCNISKASTPWLAIGTKVMSPADADI